jgi:hypothetical protein|nr:hypothetical protein [Kofleriaceae bacterium]
MLAVSAQSWGAGSARWRRKGQQAPCGPPPTFAVSSNTKVAASIVPRRRCPAEIVDGGHRRSRHEFREIRSLLAQPPIEHFEHHIYERNEVRVSPLSAVDDVGR